MKDTKHDIKENNEVLNDDASIASFVDNAVKPVPFEEEDNLDEKATSDEEFDCSSVTVSSEGERKIAALDEKSRRLKAQFAEENRLAIESMDKIREEIKQSQEREDAITNDMDEMRKRQDEIKQDLRRLDEMSKRREREEEKWKSKIDHKRKKIAKRLEKIRAERLEYQQTGLEAENENPENQDDSAVQCKNGAGHQMEHECKDAAKTTSSCLEDTSNIILYEPHELKEYKSVKQLEKKRKELRRLEKMEKKAIKREKLEQRGRKKIEKEKRKVARKLEKLRAKNLAVNEKNLGSSQSVNNQAQGVSSALLQGFPEEPQTVNQTEHQTTYVTATCDVAQKEQETSNKASDRDLTEGLSSLHARELRTSVSNEVIVALGNSELDVSEDMKKPVLDIIICETQVAELASEEIDTMHQRSFKLQSDKYVATEGSVGEVVEKKPYNEFAIDNSKESSHSGDNQMDNENASEDVEIDYLEKEDTLKDISVELYSIEEQLDLIEPDNNPKCGGELEMNFESEECASKTAVSEYDDLSSLRGEIFVNNTSKTEVVATGNVGASGKLEKTSDLITTNTRPFGSAAECLDNISVHSEMAYDDSPPQCFNGKETLAKRDAFDQVDSGSNDNYGLPECLDDADLELCTRSKGNKRTGESHEKSAPRPEYVKEDGDDFPDEFMNDGNDDAIDMTLRDESVNYDSPNYAGNGSHVANEPSPLMQKVSGMFNFGGLQPLCNSPGTGEFNSTFEDTVPSEEKLDDEGRGEDDQIPLKENSSLDHLETGSFEDETCSREYAMSFKDITKEMQEALVQRYAACTDIERAGNVEVEIVYEEVSRRSSDENSFSIVCDVASVQSCDDKDWMERDVKEEKGDVSIKKPSSSKEAMLMAREALSFESSPMHSSDFLDSTAEGYGKSALPDPPSTGKHNLREHDLIAEFDDFLDKVEVTEQIAENQGGVKTVGTSKLVGAFVQSTVESSDCKIQEVLSDHDNDESLEKSRGLKQDTPSHHDIYEDTDVPVATANSDASRETGFDSEEALNYSHSHQCGKDEDVEKAFLYRNLHPVIDAPKELDTSALFNNALQSDYCCDKDDYSSASRNSSLGNNILEKTNDQNLFLGSENTEVHSIGEVSDFADCIKGTLAATKLQDKQSLLMDVDAMNKKTKQMMEENTQNDEDSFDEKAVCNTASETSQEDAAVARPADESPVSEIQEVLREEDSKCEICDTGDELDSWGAIDDMLSSDALCVIVDKEESFFGAPYLSDVVNKGSNYKSEEEDKKTHEFETSPVSSLESKMASRERHRDSLLSPRSVVGVRVKSTNNEVCALEIETDTKLDSVGDLALPRVNGVRKGVSSAHQDISVSDNYDEVLEVGEEFQRIEYHEEPVLRVITGMGRSCKKENKTTASDVKAIGGDGFVSVDAINDETLDASLEDKFPQVDRPSEEINKSPHAAKKLLSEKGKVMKCKLNEDEFIDDFDQLLDEVEEDIRIEESMSSPESNCHSSGSARSVKEIQDQSTTEDVKTLDESVTWVTDIDNEELLPSSCDEEVAAINDSTLEVFSEYEDEPDSWGALDELIDRRFQSRDSSFVSKGGVSRESVERRRAKYERRIAAVVNISEILLHQELLAALKAAACEVTETDALENEAKQSVQKHHIHKVDINSPAKDKIQAHVTNKDNGVTFSGEKSTIGDAIEQLNKLHSIVIDIRDELSGRNGTKGQRFAVKTESDSVPDLLNIISALHDNMGEMAEELKQATKKSNKGKVKSDEHLRAEMLEESRKEKAKMLVEITIMQEKVAAFEKMNDSLHAELERTKAQLKCLQSRDEYKQRELTNLKNDFERKEKKWDDAEESLENALKDKLELLDEVEFLEDSLRFSTENNKRLENRVDELNETIKELKKRADMDNKRHEYGHLREQVELLKGSLELSNQRETLLRCQVVGLEADLSNFKHCEQALKCNLKTSENEKSRIIEQLEEQPRPAENENARMIAELTRVSDKEILLSELKKENMRVIKQLEDQLNKLTKENSMLNAELSKASEKDNQMTELKSETTKVIKQLEDQVATLKKENDNLASEFHRVSQKDNEMTELKNEMSTIIKHLEDHVANLKKENHNLATELCKLSKKNSEMIELKDKTSKFMNQLEDQLGALKKENSTLSTELYKASKKDNEMRKFKSETSKFIEQLEDQLATLRKENSMLKAELYKASEKGNQMSEQNHETSKVINKLEDQIATLKKENSTLVTELSRASKKDNQMSELQSQTSNVIKHLEDQVAKLKKENSTLATELSKVSERDKQLTELCNQVENLTTQNKLLQDQAWKAKKQFSDELQCLQEETKELGEGSMRSRRSRGSKSSDIKMLRKRIRQNEQELEFLGRFIRQRGLDFGRRPQYHIDIGPDPKDEPDKLPSAKDTLNHERQHNQDTSQVPEMENIIEGIRKSLQQRENDLQKTKDALTLKTERTTFLERRVEETEMLLEEKNKLLREKKCNLEQTDATLRQQLERSATLENQLQDMENARNTAITSIMSKDQELEEAFRRVCQKDQRIDDLIHQLKQERLDKECLKRAIEVTEYNAVREKGLLQRLRELEYQLQQTEELKETTLASLMDKQQELDQLYRSVSNKDAQIDDLTLQLKQEKLEKQDLKRAITITECYVNREKGVLERSTQLENRLQETQELREKTLVSLKNNKEALDQANNKIDELNQRLQREISKNERLRSAVEDTECNAEREKGLLEKRRAQFEIQLQEMERLQEKTQSSLKIKETELQQVYTKLSRKDDTIDELKQELKQERSEKRELRKTMERKNYNVQRQKQLLDSREEEVERLKEHLCDYEKKVEKLNAKLKQIRTELEVAEGISSRIQYEHLAVFPTEHSRHTKENVRGMGSSMVQVAERLSKLLHRQKEVDSSAALLKQKEAKAKRSVERLREQLNRRDDEMESLKSSLLKSVTEAECTRSRLREVEYENIELKKNLADESDKVKKLEILVKKLEADVQRAQNSVKDKETTLEETKGRLQLKGSLLTSLEAKLCLRDNEIEEFRVANKERGLELERVQRSLKEVKKELEISSSIITKQNEEFVHLRSSVNRKSWEADKMKFGVEPTQDEVKLLSIQLECAEKDKERLSRELAAATVRLENEQILADRQKKGLQEQVKSGLEDLKDKSKLIWDMKMSLRESTARISTLEAEKLEQDECFGDYKRNFAGGVKQLKQCLNSANENEGLLQSGIGLAEHEMSELRKENQTLKFKLPLKETGEFPQDGIEDSSSGLFKVRIVLIVSCLFGVQI